MYFVYVVAKRIGCVGARLEDYVVLASRSGSDLAPSLALVDLHGSSDHLGQLRRY